MQSFSPWGISFGAGAASFARSAASFRRGAAKDVAPRAKLFPPGDIFWRGCDVFCRGRVKASQAIGKQCRIMDSQFPERALQSGAFAVGSKTAYRLEKGPSNLI